MAEAADRDTKSVQAKRPATAKLAMLDEAMAILRKWVRATSDVRSGADGSTTLWQSIIDNGVLEAVRMWLAPIPPVGALPAVGIQKAIFEVLPKVRDAQSFSATRTRVDSRWILTHKR
jgi:transcription factor SPN1